jgi:hypothetical protein
MFTVTTMPPGLIVSVPLVTTRLELAPGFPPASGLLSVRLIVWLTPALRLPASGATVTWVRPDPSVMDQATLLPVAEAIRMNEPVGAVGLSVTVVALTLSVTGGGGGGGVVLFDGAGELGLGLVLVGLGEELWVGLGELLGELLAGVGWPPAAGVGAAGVLADVVGCTALCFGLPVLLGLPLDVVAIALLPGADVVAMSAATLW